MYRDKIRVIHDTVGKTLTIWLDESSKEAISEETGEEVILMKDTGGCVIGFEVLHYHPSERMTGLTVETVVQVGS